MTSRVRRPDDGDPYAVQAVTACSRRRPRAWRDVRLEQDMDAMLEADVEFFDHPELGRIRVRDHLVLPDPRAAADGDSPGPDEPVIA